MRRLLREAWGYGAVSAVSLAVNFAVLAFLVTILRWGNLASATISFLAGACIAYVLSVRFVFSQHRLRNRRAEFVTFVALGIIGYLVNIAVIYLTIRFLSMPVLYANCVAAAFSFGCNFLARRQVLFVQATHEH